MTFRGKGSSLIRGDTIHARAQHIRKTFCTVQLETLPLFLSTEFELVNNAVFTDPGDQSAWIYLRWLLGKVDTPTTIERAGLKRDTGILAFSRAISLTEDAGDTTADYRLHISSEAEQNIPVKCEPVRTSKYSNLWVSFICISCLENPLQGSAGH